MEFEWDDAKANANQLRHGISFDEAMAAFIDPACLVLDATREGDGEGRRRVLGEIGGRVFSVVFTWRGEVVRIISARRASKPGRRIYHGDRASTS